MDRQQIAEGLAQHGYIAGSDLAMALWLMTLLGRPLLLEGEAGVGKTETAKALAALHGAKLIRLQCYEGLDASAALYEWNYQRQLLAIKTREGVGENANAIEEHIFSERYLLERPLLAAIRREKPPVLLVDEVDRADEEFEAFLLELLSDFQVSIPELGTIKAISIPRVVLTSNGTRELSDALRRRCLYHYVDFPDVDHEARIIVTKSPGIDAVLSREEAAARYELPYDREADLVVTGDRNTVIGASEAEHDVSALAGHRLRSHGGAAEQTVPFLLSRPLTPDYRALAESGRLRNFAIFEYALSGTA